MANAVDKDGLAQLPVHLEPASIPMPTTANACHKKQDPDPLVKSILLLPSFSWNKICIDTVIA
jgi:hypothetical protein